MQDILDEFSGVHLKSKREGMLLTQEELATELGVTKLTISQWENNKNNPSKRHLRALKKFFQTNKEEK